MKNECKICETDKECEKQLILAAQKDPLKFKHLFERYYDSIFNYAVRRTGDVSIAEDITANTFFIALTKIKKFKWKGISFAAWLYRIATNEINLMYRKKKRVVKLT